ncbi:MAG: sensor histidine kinase [Ruthenibacterium lactatiformans]
MIYTVVLFFLLRRRANRIQQDYAALLAAARRMAGGDLATPVEGDMGLFDPLKDELNQVRAGFEKAVAAEVRSQNMKTELITNVSHDLKTPLTAIITYVDLLKDPALSAEDRAKYIETLDKKSQRLKRLIEDLFEVSKAATRNVAMHYAEVDLAALLKQVQYELADKTEASGIDFRWQLPEERMPLVLDGQKTCRIFENLVVNITKYGMPGTRAYITLMPQEHGAQVVFKTFRHRAGFQRGRDHRPLCAGRPFATPRAAAWTLPLPRALPNCRAERSPSQWTATCSRPR